MKDIPTQKLLIEANKKLEKYKTDLLLDEVIKKLEKIVKKKERKKAKSSPREFIKKKMKYKVDKELKKMKSLTKTKKTGKGISVDLNKDLKELLEMKKQGIKLTTISKETFKDGRQIGGWITHYKKKLSDEQLKVLGLKAVEGNRLIKYLKIREKYDNELSKEGITESEKALLLNNIAKIEALIKREERKQ